MKRFWKRAVSACLAAVLTLSLCMTAFGAEGAIEKSKKATDLNKKKETTVTLSIGAAQSKTSSDVVFVLDKSTSVDVIEEALSMLSELKDRASAHTIKVGVVIFNRSANRVLELTELREDTCEKIEAAMKTKFSSGTNVQAGIQAGYEMLAQDTSTAADAKHLVLVSDGVTYLWGEEPLTVYSEIDSRGEEKIFSGNEMSVYQKHHADMDSYVKELSDVASWMETYKASFEKTALDYADTYERGQYSLKEYPEGYPKKYVPVKDMASLGSANDLAMYEAAKEYKKAAQAGYHLYSYGDTEYLTQYPFGHAFMLGLQTIGGMSRSYTAGDANVSGMFDEVESQILYEIQRGTVTDVIGKNFELISGTFRMTRGGVELSSVSIPGQEDIVYFGEPDANGAYPYGVTYESEKNQFVWEIFVPVEKAEPLTLSYDLKLINQETEPGQYTVPTNEKAELQYTSTDGTQGKEEFEKPTVTYVVEEEPEVPEDSQTPETPKTGDMGEMQLWIGLLLFCGGVFILCKESLKRTGRNQ